MKMFQKRDEKAENAIVLYGCIKARKLGNGKETERNKNTQKKNTS